MKKIIPALFLAALIVGTYFILHNSKFRYCEGHIFGTTYHIKYASTHDLSEEIETTLLEVDRALSMFNDSSTLSCFNRGEAYSPNPLFDEVIGQALEVSNATGGAFDITVAPLVNAWGFGFKNRENVTPQQIDSIRQFVGYKLLTFDPKTSPSLSKRHPNVSIDCGAIAKGFGVQSVARMLSTKGCSNYMVEIGGEVVVKGQSPKGERWTLGINKPIDDSTNVSNKFQRVIRLTDCAVATSGNYRNFYYKGGRKYAHTIDPSTGYPVEHSLLSATVVCKSCTVADAYATSFMVMGLDKAKAYVEGRKDLDAYFIYADAEGKLCSWASPGFERYIVKP